jgi:hypothetical protein
MFFISLWSISQSNTVLMNTLPLVGTHLPNYTGHTRKAVTMKFEVFQHPPPSIDVARAYLPLFDPMKEILRGSGTNGLAVCISICLTLLTLCTFNN